MKVFLAIPSMGWIRSDLIIPIVAWLKHYNLTLWNPSGLRPVSYARNMAAKAFLESDADYLWVVDADVLPPMDALDQLIKADKPVITGIVNMMKLDVDGIIKSVGVAAIKKERGIVPIRGKGVTKIDICGSACILIKREVFNQIDFPWYEERSWGDTRGADFIFCEKLIKNGIELFAHFDVACNHKKEIDI